VKDPFSLKTYRRPDINIDKQYIAQLYDISREKYARPLAEIKKVIEEKQSDVIKTIEEFAEPII